MAARDEEIKMRIIQQLCIENRKSPPTPLFQRGEIGSGEFGLPESYWCPGRGRLTRVFAPTCREGR